MDEGARNRFNAQAKQKGFRGRGGAFTATGQLKKSYKEFYRKRYTETPSFTRETAPPLPSGIVFNPNKNTFVQEKSMFGIKGGLKKKFRDQGLIKTRDGFVDYEPRNKTISGKVHYVLREFSRPGRQFKDKAGRKKRFKDFKATANFSNIRFDDNFKTNAQNQALKEIMELLNNPSVGQNFELKEVSKLSDIRKTFGQRQLKQKDIRLKELTLMIDGEEKAMWEKEGNRCVPNYLNYLYKDYLEPDHLSDDFFDACFDYKWESEGVSAVEISNWCRVLNIRMIALDQFNKVVLVENPPTDKLRKVPTLIFRIHNTHIFPIEDEEQRLSISCSVLQENEIKYNPNKDKEEKEFTKYKVEYVDLEEVGNAGRWLFMCRKMLEKNIEVLSENIEMSGTSNLSSFILNGVKYVFSNGRNCYIRDFYGSRNIEWDGTDISQYVGRVLSQNLKDIISKPNQITNQILMSGEIKNRTHIDGNINDVIFDYNGDIDVDYIHDNKIKQFDIKKCHSSILTKPLEDWMIITWRDNFKPFIPEKHSEIKLGLYYVETKDRTLFIGNNIYSSAIVRSGLDFGIIQEGDIKYFLHASQKREKELFHQTFEDYKKIILDMRLKDKVKENPNMKRTDMERFIQNYEFNEFDVAFNKLLNNTTSGFLGKTTIKKYETGISTDENEAFDNLCEFDREGLDVFSMREKVEWEGKEHHFHIFGNKKVIQRSEHNLPFYIQILDQQLLKMYDMRSKLTGGGHFEGKWTEAEGREVLWRNIDCIIVKNPYPLCEKPKHLQEWGDIVEEDINLDRTRFRLKEYRDVNIKWDDYIYNKEWYEVKSISSSMDACEGLMELYNQNQGCCLEGCAGAGKSYVLKQFRQKLGWDEVAVVSFTGIASLNIRGSTFHSTFKLDLQGRIASGTMKHLKGVKAILVDEGSMVSGVLMNVLSLAKKQFNIPIYFFLDWRQLPPIEKTLSGEIMKNNEGFIELCDGNYAKVKYNSKYGRYDDDLYNFTEKFDSLGWFFKDGIKLLGSRTDTMFHITATNKKRMELNEIIMKQEWEKTPENKRIPVKIDPDRLFSCRNNMDEEKEEIMKIVIDEEYVECDCPSESEGCDICNSSPEEEEIEIELYSEFKEDLRECNKEFSKFIKPQHELQPCYFFEGFKSICMKTNKKLGIVNGEQFELVSFGESKFKSGWRSYGCDFIFKSLTRLRQKKDGNVDEDKEYLEKFPNYEIRITLDEFFSYFAPSYAMTCHKTQSQKIPEPFTIHEIRNPMVTEEWLYTAITRAGKFTDINVSLI
jgi:hypothetical protein